MPINPFVKRTADSALDLLSGQSKSLTPTECSVLDNSSHHKPPWLHFQKRRTWEKLARLGFLWTEAQAKIYSALPLHSVDLEITSHCQAKCPICPREEMPRGHGLMKAEMFYSLARQMKPFQSEVIFCGIGESLLHPLCLEFIRHLKQEGFFVRLVSNGHLLTPPTRQALRDARLDHLSVSVQGLSPQVYAQTMGLPYEETLQNIRAFLKESRATVPTTICLVETPQNHAEIDAFRRHWRSLGADVLVSPVHNRGGALINPAIHPQLPSNAAPLRRCGLFNARIFIAWDGRVLACCNDLTGTEIIGHLSGDSLAVILERKQKRILEEKLFPMCAVCDDPTRLSVLDYRKAETRR